MADPHRARRRALEQRRAVVRTDLSEIDQQVRDDELDDGTAAELRARYRQDLAAIDDELAAIEDQPAARIRADDHDDPATPSSRRRRVTGAAVALLLAVVVGGVLIGELDDRTPGGLVTNTDQIPAGGRDLADVTVEEMEAVVADNPTVTGMRLALADRYFAEGRLDDALGHYMTALEQRDDAGAMSRVAWILYDSRRDDLALEMASAAVAQDPDGVEPRYVLARIQLDALDDPVAAIETLAPLEDRTDLSDADANAIAGLIADAEEATR